ncbi:MAG: formate dehydrogenase accessory sulfurtransferase FdhD [Thermodesulfobacteriota bacterium]
MRNFSYMPEPTQEVKYTEFDGGEPALHRGPLALETALEVVVNGRSHSLLMQTPGREKELVTGYLYTEGLIETPAEIGEMRFAPGPEFLGAEGLRVEVTLPGLNDAAGLPARPAVALASCGLCGKEALDQLGRGLNRVRSRQRFAWSVLFGLLPDLRRHQPLYEKTRGVHAVALYRADGTFFCCFEDVGRHNALDKVIGHGLLSGWSFEDKLMVLSGRASLEMVLKTARSQAPLLLCFSSPTALAVDAAKALNLTLVGRQEERTLAGFTHTRRLVGESPGEVPEL